MLNHIFVEQNIVGCRIMISKSFSSFYVIKNIIHKFSLWSGKLRFFL